MILSTKENIGTLSDLLVKNIFNKNITFYNENNTTYLTADRLIKHSLNILTYLNNIGLKKGDKLLFFINDIEIFIKTFWACIVGGIVIIPMDSLNMNKELEKSLKQLGIYHYIVDISNEEFTLNGLNRVMVPTYDIDVDIDIDYINNVQIYENDLAYIQFSSGSTDLAKGVLLTHKNILSNIKSILKRIKIRESDSFISWLPLTHNLGLIGMHLTPLVGNIDQVLISKNLFLKNPQIWLHLSSKHSSTISASPNFGFNFVNKSISINKNIYNLEKLRVIFNGAEDVDFKTCDEFNKLLFDSNINSDAIIPAYGLSEGTVAVSFNNPNSGVRKLNIDKRNLSIGDKINIDPIKNHELCIVSLGKVLDCCSIDIVNDDFQSLEEGYIGKILIKGESISKGYIDNTNRCIGDYEYIDTGDIGFLFDEELYILGREKDIVILNGKNYHSVYLEKTLKNNINCHNLEDLVVIKDYSEKTNNSIVVYIKVLDINLNIEYLIRKIKEISRMVLNIKVSKVYFVEKIPKTSSGKIKRYLITENIIIRGNKD